MDIEQLAKKLETALYEGRTTKTKIYKSIGTTFATLKGIENGTLNITLKTYDKLNNYLDGLK